MENKKIRNSKPKIDLTGQRFGRWIVLEYRKPGRWLCKCDCGNTKEVEGRNLRAGKTQSCGCLQKEIVSQIQTKKNMIGEKYGYLTILEEVKEDNKLYYKCRCNCGNIKNIPRANLINGHTISCGCISSKGEAKIAQILRENNIQFEQQKTFDTCRFKDTNALAKFDFYLPNENVLIEYDGEQHFSVKSSDWNNEDRFIYTRQHDNYKNQWCQNNKILLIRIPYTEYSKISLDYIRKEIMNGR